MPYKKNYYKDKTLRQIFNQMIRTRKIKYEFETYINLNNINWDELQYDARNYIGINIVLVIISCNDHLYGHYFTSEQILKWVKEIRDSIPDNIRWKKIGSLIEKKSKNHHKTDINKMNLFEKQTLMNIILKYWERVDSKKKLKPLRLLDNYLKSLGFKGIKHYRLFQSRMSYNLSIDFLIKAKKLVLNDNFIPDELINKLCNEYEIPKEIIAWDHNFIEKLNLEKLPELIMPLFFEKGNNLKGSFLKCYFFDEHTFKSNDLGLLCFSNENFFRQLIRDPYIKGILLNDALYELLTGKTFSMFDIPTMSGLIYFGKEEELEKDQRFENSIRVKYYYSNPKVTKGNEVKIKKETHPCLTNFLDQIGKKETDIDLILIHNKTPKHVIISECHFSSKYNHSQYSKRIVKLEKLTKFLKNNQDSKKELGIDNNYRIIPIVFGSSYGKLHEKISQSNHSVILSSLSLTLFGYLKKQIQSFINGNTWNYNLNDIYQNDK